MKKYPFPIKISLSSIEKHQNDENIRSYSMESWSYHRKILFSVAEFGNLVIHCNTHTDGESRDVLFELNVFHAFGGYCWFHMQN